MSARVVRKRSQLHRAAKRVPSNRTHVPGVPRRKCLLVAEHLSHYREGVYRILDDSPNWEFTFFGGRKTRDGLIPGIQSGVLKNHVTVTNRWIADRLLWQPGLMRICLTARYDAAIFVGSAPFLSTWLAAILMRLRGVTVYFWTIGWHRPDQNPFKRAIRATFYRLANHLLLYGQDGYETAIDAGLSPSRMTVIGNSYSGTTSEGVETDETARTHADVLARLDEDAIYVGAVARLTRLKRFDMLIDAVALIRKRRLDVRLLFVGDGEISAELKQHAQNDGVPAAFLGSVHSEEDLAKIYARLTITVLPERAGLTVMQSLLHGTPVVTVNDPTRQVPEFRAVIPGVTGDLYRAGDLLDLATKIEELVGLVRNNGPVVADKCRDEVKARWSVEAHARRILAVMDDLE